MTVQEWLDAASADAERRGLPELKPLLESLARSLQSLRDADAAFAHPAVGDDTGGAPEASNAV
jgi:hypothetical protein